MDSEDLIKRLRWYVDDRWSDPLDKEDAKAAADALERLTSAAQQARRALCDLIASRDPVVYSDALRALDLVLGEPVALASEQPQASGEKT